MSRRVMSLALGLIASAAFALPTSGQQPPDSGNGLGPRIDQIVRKVLKDTGVPGASVAVVRNGQIALAQAYGQARLEPPVPATPAMRFSIGSISKQFTATAILLLQEQGKLSLDDRVGRFLPDLTKANDVTVRQLLSHTSGYQDYWPQDYVPPFMLQPVTAERIMDTWARKPLDFEPGTAWQYSNTNYVIAGVIAERAAGRPLVSFLTDRVFRPLGMTSVTNIDQDKLTDSDPIGYLRYALGPLRPAPKEGRGWLFAAGELAMTASDLARWDVSLMDRKILAPASYEALETTMLLKNGVATGYGLGVDVGQDRGRRTLGHGGEVSGFTAENLVYPDDRAAVVVLTNQDAVSAGATIERQIAALLVTTEDPATATKLAQAKKILEGLQRGTIDRNLLTANASSYFSEQALQDFAAGLGPLGTPQAFVQTGERLRGGMTLRVYSVRFAARLLRVWTYEMPDGKLEQFQVAPE
jgi:CubicO group peptidase (beta-lactamase class C family)